MLSKWEISMEDAIEATKPLPKYEGIWESFLSDADIKIAIDKNRTLRNILEMWFSGKLGDEWMKKAVTWVSEEAGRRMKAV
jgi:hypothetical protein